MTQWLYIRQISTCAIYKKLKMIDFGKQKINLKHSKWPKIAVRNWKFFKNQQISDIILFSKI